MHENHTIHPGMSDKQRRVFRCKSGQMVKERGTHAAGKHGEGFAAVGNVIPEIPPPGIHGTGKAFLHLCFGQTFPSAQTDFPERCIRSHGNLPLLHDDGRRFPASAQIGRPDLRQGNAGEFVPPEQGLTPSFIGKRKVTLSDEAMFRIGRKRSVSKQMQQRHGSFLERAAWPPCRKRFEGAKDNLSFRILQNDGKEKGAAGRKFHSGHDEKRAISTGRSR